MAKGHYFTNTHLPFPLISPVSSAEMSAIPTLASSITLESMKMEWKQVILDLQ